MGFEHLHRHSDFSILDGFARVSEYAEYQSQINQKYLCITDHGVMGAIPQQIAESEKHNLFPLFGVELYVNSMQPKVANRSESAEFRKSLGDGSTADRVVPDGTKASILQKKFDKSCHLLAIAYSDQGYSNLVKLTSWAWIHGYYRKPRVNHEVLMKYKEGIIFTSTCANSEIARAFFDGGDENGFAMVEKYMAMFGEHFYLELMMLDFKDQKPYDLFLIRAHDRYHIPLILTQDCHYCRKEQSHNQRLMLMQQNKRTLAEVQTMIDSGEAEDLFELQDTNLWLKSEDELNQMWELKFNDTIDYELYKQSKANTVKIAEFAKGVQINREIKLPKIPDADAVLWEEIKKGYMKRGCPRTSQYAKRIKEEYDLITEKGFASYFLIQKMMVDEARTKGPEILGFGDGSEAVGPGRGSVAGSLVAYCLRLHDVEPIIHDLRFSRFLSPARGGKQMKIRHTIQPISHESVDL
jgi:DNA polymerase-3 subunit alpha